MRCDLPETSLQRFAYHFHTEGSFASFVANPLSPLIGSIGLILNTETTSIGNLVDHQAIKPHRPKSLPDRHSRNTETRSLRTLARMAAGNQNRFPLDAVDDKALTNDQGRLSIFQSSGHACLRELAILCATCSGKPCSVSWASLILSAVVIRPRQSGGPAFICGSIFSLVTAFLFGLFRIDSELRFARFVSVERR